MVRFYVLSLLIFLCIASSCSKDETSKIGFSSPKNDYDLVVEGGITTFQTTQYIRLTKPALSPDATPIAVSKATVTINDGKRNIVFKESTTLGLYSGIVSNNTNYNQAYKLTVIANGKEYTAIDTLKQVVNIVDDFLPLSTMALASPSIQLNIPKHTFGFLNSCKWLISYTGVPIWNPAKFDGTQLYTYTHRLGSPNAIYPLLNQNREAVLKETDLVSIYKFSLSNEYARYLYSIFLETDWRGIFSSSPGKIKGNISGNAEGFFYVTDVDLRKYRVKELL